MKKLLFTLFALLMLGTTQAQVYPGIQPSPIIPAEGGCDFRAGTITPLIGKVTEEQFVEMFAPNTPTITEVYCEGEYDVEIYDSQYKVWREVRVYFKPENGGKMQSFSFYDPYPMGKDLDILHWKDSQGKKFESVGTQKFEGKLTRSEWEYKNIRAIVQYDRYRVAYSLISQ